MEQGEDENYHVKCEEGWALQGVRDSLIYGWAPYKLGYLIGKNEHVEADKES